MKNLYPLTIINLVLILHTLFIMIEAYSTMPPVWQPSPDIKCFNLVWVNAIGGAAFADGSQSTTVVPYPAGVTFTSAPRLILSFIRY